MRALLRGNKAIHHFSIGNMIIYLYSIELLMGGRAISHSIDTSKFDAMTNIMASIAQRHRSRQDSELSETLYFELMERYFRRIQKAQKEGQSMVAYSGFIPPEVFYALDIVPMQMESTSNGTVATLKIHDEVFALSQGVGQWLDTCSSRRIEAAMLANGWIPRPDAIVWGCSSCDPNAKSGYLTKKRYGIPGFFLDHPYEANEKDRRYYAAELAELLNFLEGLTGRKMTHNRLHHVLNNTWKMAQLHREICELQGTTPCPMSNRKGSQILVIGSMYSGTEEGVNYFQTVKDELQASVKKGVGYAYQEKHRLIGLFHAPTYVLKIMDWMEREQGAVIVAEPFSSHWGDWEVDTNDLLGSLAAKCFAIPNSRQLHGPAYQAAIPDAVEDVLRYHADGAIYWANVTCPQCLSMIRLLTDALQEKAGIPTLVIHLDTMDPSSISHEEIKAKTEDFLERLSKRKQQSV